MKTLSEVKSEMLEAAKSKPMGDYAVFDRNGNVAAHSSFEFPHCFIDEADLEWAKANGYRTQEEEIDGKTLTWVYAKAVTDELVQSADGQYYLVEKLPENGDEFVTERYAAEVRAERNARLSDTDDYIKMQDMTVKKSAKASREALTDEERAEVMTYREALRDLPTVQGFPFVEYPTIPACIAYECGQKADARAAQATMYRGF